MTERGSIELTVRLWSTGDATRFEEYLDGLIDLLPRHRGNVARRIDNIEREASEPDTILVMGFHDTPSIDGFLNDPAREDLADTARLGVARSLITDGRDRVEPSQPGTVHRLHPPT